VDKNGDGLTLLRRLGSQKQRSVLHRDMRPHIMAEHVEPTDDQPSTGTCSVKITGYLRGQSLNVCDLVHISGWGDFRLSQISSVKDPHTLEIQNSDQNYTEVLQTNGDSGEIVIENIPNPMDAEQTWPTEDELKSATLASKSTRKVPKGTSSYQACWIPEPEEDDSGDEEFSENDAESMQMEDEEEEEAVEWESVSNDSENGGYDETIDTLEEEQTLLQIQAARDEAAFPDEVDTPRDIPARQRFAKYRGLASFRTSPWDTKENLPLSYAKIFQFENFERSRRRVLKEQEDRFDVVAVNFFFEFLLFLSETNFFLEVRIRLFENIQNFQMT